MSMLTSETQVAAAAANVHDLARAAVERSGQNCMVGRAVTAHGQG